MGRLALLGGQPIHDSEIPLEDPWPETRPEDRAAVERVLESGQFVGLHNPEVEALEEEYARFTGARYALALGTGTASLHAAVAASGVQPGDEVIVPALTFLASATAVMHQTGIPVFADIDPDTYNLDPQSVAQVISPRTRAIMAVDMHGLPAEYDALLGLARENDLVLISDAAHAVGASYHGRRVGNLADITGTSIMPAKQLPACGEGGLFSTNKRAFYNQASLVRLFGEVIREGEARAYNAYTLGWNYRMNPIQAAYARSQLARLEENSRVFYENGQRLSERLDQLPGLIPPHIPAGSTHVFHMYRIGFDPKTANLDVPAGRFAEAVARAMAAEGLPLRYYQHAPVPGQALFQLKEGFGRGIPWTLPEARSVDYDIEAYPVTLGVLESTRCLGKPGSSGPNYFRNLETLEKYATGFYKLWDHLDELVEVAQAIDYSPPWASVALSTRGDWTVMAPARRES